MSTDRKRIDQDYTIAFDHNLNMQSRSQELFRPDEASSSGGRFLLESHDLHICISRDLLISLLGEGANAKRLHKQSPIGTPISRPPEPTPLAGVRPDPTAATAASRRRQSSFKNQKPPAAVNGLQASPSKRYASRPVYNIFGFNTLQISSRQSLATPLHWHATEYCSQWRPYSPDIPEQWTPS